MMIPDDWRLEIDVEEDVCVFCKKKVGTSTKTREVNYGAFLRGEPPSADHIRTLRCDFNRTDILHNCV